MHPRFSVVLAVVAGLTVAGCAGTNVTPAPSISNLTSQSAAGGSESSAQTTPYFSLAGATHQGAPTLRVKPDASYKRALYVLNSAANTVQVLTNKYYRQLGVITNGISHPQAMTIDGRGNLYITNQNYPNSSIAKYAPGESSPSFTYNEPLFPSGVTVDRHGNLFVADNNGYVYQYAQGIQNPIASCYVGNGAFGVAVDGNGNVFMSAWEFDNGPAVIELAGGLSGCNVTVLMYLSPPPNQPAPSLAVDANDNLILPWENTVDVINPPYSTVTTTVGYCSATCVVSLNKKNKLLFLSDSGTNKVVVINYDTRMVIRDIGLQNGISQANGVVDAPNAIY